MDEKKRITIPMKRALSKPDILLEQSTIVTTEPLCLQMPPDNNNDNDNDLFYNDPYNDDSSRASEVSDFTSSSSYYGSVLSPSSPNNQHDRTMPNEIPPTPSNQLPTDDEAFIWAFLNYPATYQIAGVLLLVGGLITLTAGIAIASLPLMISGGVVASIGAALGLFGYFKQPEPNQQETMRSLYPEPACY